MQTLTKRVNFMHKTLRSESILEMIHLILLLFSVESIERSQTTKKLIKENNREINRNAVIG